MKCENYLEWISLYIDHELKGKDLKAFEDHLNHCTSCQEEVAFLREIVKDIGALEKIELPNGFHEKLMEKIKLEDKIKQQETHQVFSKNKKWYFNWRIGASLAAVFVFTLLIFEVFHINPSKGAMPESANMHMRSMDMDEGSPEMANDTATEDVSIDTFDLKGIKPATWEIQTKEYEKSREEIIQVIEEIEGEKIIIEDTLLEDTNNPRFTIEITLEKSQKDLLISQIKIGRAHV